MVRVAGFEPTASWSRTMRATNCATPGYYVIPSFQHLAKAKNIIMALPVIVKTNCRRWEKKGRRGVLATPLSATKQDRENEKKPLPFLLLYAKI